MIASVTHLQKGRKENPGTTGQFSLASVPGKIMQPLILLILPVTWRTRKWFGVISMDSGLLTGWRHWNISHRRKGWESWGCLAWRKEGSRSSSRCRNVCRKAVKKTESGSFQCPVTGQKDNRDKLKHGMFLLNTRKHFFFFYCEGDRA